VALDLDLPRSPCAALDPAHRWFPADEAVRATAYERLLQPLVARIRIEVKAWGGQAHAGASETSIALLHGLSLNGPVSLG
jgi:type III restriction enzyme